MYKDIISFFKRNDKWFMKIFLKKLKILVRNGKNPAIFRFRKSIPVKKAVLADIGGQYGENIAYMVCETGKTKINPEMV